MIRRPLGGMAYFSQLSQLSSVQCFFQYSTTLRVSIASFVSAQCIQGNGNRVPFTIINRIYLATFSFHRYHVCPSFLRMEGRNEEERLRSIGLLRAQLNNELPIGERERKASVQYLFLCTFRSVQGALHYMGVYHRYSSITTLSRARIRPLFALYICLRQ